jgi:hypothetical protein
MASSFPRKLILLIAFGATALCHAADPWRKNTRNAIETALYQAISKQVIYPVRNDRGMSGEVLVDLVVDQDGYVVVNACRSANPKLRDYVLLKLDAMRIGTNGQDMERTVRFVFQPE